MDDKQTVEFVEELVESVEEFVRNVKAATEFLQDVADLK